MIPVVDVGCCLQAGEDLPKESDCYIPKDKPGVKEAATLLHEAICEHGFCFLKNHGIPENKVEEFFRTSKTFFHLPVSTKEKYTRGLTTYHGWIGVEQERLNQKRTKPDAKEAFNFLPYEEGSFPSEVPEMGQAFSDLFGLCLHLAHRICDLLGLALGLKDPGFLRKCHQKAGKKGSNTVLRSLHYPPVSHLKEGQIQCGEHSDYGTITLLFQDDVGGLQILGKDGEYHDVVPVPGAVLVNFGDLLERWSADKYPATKHRVIIPRRAVEAGLARQSAAFFCQPDDDALITCLDGSDRYPPITSGEYLAGRMASIIY